MAKPSWMVELGMPSCFPEATPSALPEAPGMPLAMTTIDKASAKRRPDINILLVLGG
jgi:hypothetical protein